MESLWHKLKWLAGLTGVALAHIPYDEERYEVWAIWPDSRQLFGKSDDEDAAIEQAISKFEKLNTEMEEGKK